MFADHYFMVTYIAIIYWGERSEPRIGEVNANSVCMYVINRPTDRPVALRMRRNMLSTCCSCARPTNALHSPSMVSSVRLPEV